MKKGIILLTVLLLLLYPFSISAISSYSEKQITQIQINNQGTIYKGFDLSDNVTYNYYYLTTSNSSTWTTPIRITWAKLQRPSKTQYIIICVHKKDIESFNGTWNWRYPNSYSSAEWENLTAVSTNYQFLYRIVSTNTNDLTDSVMYTVILSSDH